MEILYCKSIENEKCDSLNKITTLISEMCDDDLSKSTEYQELVNVLTDKYSCPDHDIIKYILDDIMLLVKSTYSTNIIKYISDTSIK